MNAVIGQPLPRVEGRPKVTGTATYAAEFNLPDLAHAALILSTIAKGRITAMESSAAERAPGVCAVITHLNAPRLPYRPMAERPPVDPQKGEQLRVFQGSEILFSGQPIGVVIADSLEQAEHAASLVRINYDSAPASTLFEVSQSHLPSESTAKAGRPGESSRGDPDRAFHDAPVKIDHFYSHARQYHNAMEPHVTIAAWSGDHLTLYDKTQWVDNDRSEIAHVFGIAEEHIRVVSPYVGGAFGSALRTWPHVTIAALGARLVGRPVRLELTRRQLFTSIGYRPRTDQRVKLGAERHGKLTAVIQEAVAETSTYEEYAEDTLQPAQIAYSCHNVRTGYHFLEIDANSPCPMRAPGISTGLLALEMAMDELADRLALDPVELRLRNYAEGDEDQDAPWSSKELRACYRLGAERIQWQRRPRTPGSLRKGNQGIGYGMATALFPAMRSPASAKAVIFADGSAEVCSAASDMGPGTYTSMTQVAADALHLPVEKIHFKLGDTSMPTAPVHGGSMTMASVGNGIKEACESARAKVLALADEPLVAGADIYRELLGHAGVSLIEATETARPSPRAQKFSSCAFGAVFVQVAVDADLGVIRVPRIVGAYDVGRVINPRTARSQCLGGMIGGLGMALLEGADWDARLGRVMNGSLAEYLIPVHADIKELEALFVDSDDREFNPLGVKGLAELGLCGVAPAIANAVYNACGIRVRELPITPEKLMAPQAISDR